MNSQRDPCAGCVYQTLVGGYLICDYISITGHRRPCPFGEGCIVKQTEGGEAMKNWDKAAALKLWEDGKSDFQIAGVVGVSAQTIRKWRKEENLKSNFDPAFARKPKTVDASDGDGQERTEPDDDGPEETGPAHVIVASGDNDCSGSLTATPVELHLELGGGWARLRAPSWEQAAKLWRMLDVCVEALSAGTGHG